MIKVTYVVFMDFKTKKKKKKLRTILMWYIKGFTIVQHLNTS